MKSQLPFAFAVMLSLSTAAQTEDKSAYNLFNPTPNSLLRELNTDRPDKTESPYTLDAGHFQIESDLFTFTQDHDTSAGADTLARSWSFAALNLKAGLWDHLDLQVVVETCTRVTTEDRIANRTTQQSGFGDITLRLKANCWGNDGGTTAFGVMPFVKLPTNQDHLGNDEVEGGLILPFAIGLPADWDMCLMTEVDFMADAAGAGHHPEFINTITFGHDLVGTLGGYIEFFSAVSTDDAAAWIGTLDLGLTYGLGANMQLDAGVNLGITEAADDVNPFLGFSIRF